MMAARELERVVYPSLDKISQRGEYLWKMYVQNTEQTSTKSVSVRSQASQACSTSVGNPIVNNCYTKPTPKIEQTAL